MAAPVQSSRFWTTGGAGDGASTYTRDQLAEAFRNAFLSDTTTQGVFNGLAVSGTASPLTIAVGASCVYGYFHFITTAGDLTISTPAVGTTGWHVVLRADWTAQTVRAVAVRNTDGVSAVPSVTQSAGTTWEIRIASGTITTGGVIAVTDTRQFCAGPAKLTATRIPFATTGGALTDSSALTFASNQVRVQAAAPGVFLDETDGPAKGAFIALDAGLLQVQRRATGFGANEATPFVIDIVNERVGVNDASPDYALDVVGQVEISPGSALPPLVLGANGQGQRVAGLVAEPVGTLGLTRQGGSASDWSVAGNSTQSLATLSGAKIQFGVKALTFSASANASATVTFPTAFSDKPVVFVASADDNGAFNLSLAAAPLSASQFVISGKMDSSTTETIEVAWLAIGPP